jgi:hypothetical protein
MKRSDCRACGAPLPDPAAPCPKCGYAQDPAFRRKLLQFIVLFAILGLLWLLFLTKGLWLKNDTTSHRHQPDESAWTKH